MAAHTVDYEYYTIFNQCPYVTQASKSTQFYICNGFWGNGKNIEFAIKLPTQKTIKIDLLNK